MPRAPQHRVGRRALAAPVLAAVALAAAPAPAAAQAIRYTRPLEVAEAGWVRVPLSPEVVRRAGAGGGVRLFGPEGEELAFARRPAAAPPERRAVAVLAPEPAEDGWWIPLEVAPGRRPHELLLVELGEGGGAAPSTLRLEASPDGEAWTVQAAREPAPEGGVVALPYPATGLRRLRLHWPGGTGAAEPPAIASAAVQEVPAGAFRVSVARPDCRAVAAAAGPAGTVCSLPVGGAGRYLRRLCFTVASDGAGAYRLFAATDGRWEAIGEDAWAGAAASTPRCALLDLTLAGELEPLRLELYGGGEEPPAVRDAAAGFAPEVVLFEARRPGLHTLAYGPAVFRSSREGEADPPPDVAPVLVAPGLEEASEVPASALALPSAAGPAPAVRFQETWDLTAEAPEPGQLHRLPLPAAVYAASEEDLADLRLLLSTGGGSSLQVPYVLWRPDEPALAAERRGAEPFMAGDDGAARRLRMAPPEPGLAVSAVVVSASPGAEAWRRRVRVRSPAAGGEEEVGEWIDWTCPPRPPLPCRVTVPLDLRTAGALVVEIDDGAAGPLPAVDLELWRRLDVLLFPWPAEGTTPVLAVGAAGLSAPGFDLSARAEELVARPWRPAGLALEGGTGGRLGAATVTLALLAAAATLMVLLNRILASKDPGRRDRRA